MFHVAIRYFTSVLLHRYSIALFVDCPREVTKRHTVQYYTYFTFRYTVNSLYHQILAVADGGGLMGIECIRS